MISDFKGLDREFDILMSMVDASGGAPMSISLAQSAGNPQGWRRILAKIDEANVAGRQIKAQVAPRAIGVLLGLTVTNNPFSDHATYRTVSELPLDQRLRQMSTVGFREALLAERTDDGFLHRFQKIWALGSEWDYEPAPDQSVAALATKADISPAAMAYDLMLENEGTGLLYYPFANYAEDTLDCCREMILAPNTVMGLGDGGAHVGAISDASFITYLLTHWGRDRKRGELIDLPTLIKAQTSDTARAVGFDDRGLIKPGLKGDLNIIDFDNLRSGLPHVVNDLPSGAPRLEQRASGYIATILNGAVTYREGVATGDLPGRLVRRK